MNALQGEIPTTAGRFDIAGDVFGVNVPAAGHEVNPGGDVRDFDVSTAGTCFHAGAFQAPEIDVPAAGVDRELLL